MFDSIKHETRVESKILPRQTVVQSAEDYRQTSEHILKNLVGQGVLQGMHCEIKWACLYDPMTDTNTLRGRYVLNGQDHTFEKELRPCLGGDSQKDLIKEVATGFVRNVANQLLQPAERPFLEGMKH